MQSRDIKLGALYELDGVICRVKRKMESGNTFLLSHHKRFHTFAKASELKKISKSRVRKYVVEAN